MKKKTYIKPEMILHVSAVDNNVMLMGSIKLMNSDGTLMESGIIDDEEDVEQASKGNEIWNAWDD